MQASAPANGAGELDGTQLISANISDAPFPGVPTPPTPYPGTHGKELDSCTQYGTVEDKHTPIAGGGTATYLSADSPGGGLRDQWRLFTMLESFTLEFVYKPSDAPGTPSGRRNIWVPLGHLGWSWNGTALNTGDPSDPKWRLEAHGNNADPVGVAADDPLPTWKALYRPSNVPCPPFS